MRKSIIALALALAFVNPADAAHKKIKVHKEPVPAFSSKSFLIADNLGTVLTEQDSYTIRPIASISKLMVALLASEQDLEEKLSIPVNRTVQSSIPKNVPSLTRKELLTLALVRSDNFAAQILCLNIDNCIEEMNNKAANLGMENTHYIEPTGLNNENVSTAHDLLKLAIAAEEQPVIKELSSMPNAEINVGKKIIKIHNTNPLTSKFDVILSKTGYTSPAGGCLLMIINSAFGERILILLGSKNAHTRIPDMEKLVAEIN